MRMPGRAGVFALSIVAALALALTLRPELRIAARAAWSDPRLFPAYGDDPRIRYEADARDCAADVAALLPAAIARIETVHGRPFARAPIVMVYRSFDLYAHANGLETASIAGVTRPLIGGDVAALLSPTLCGDEHARLAGVVTHELSHVHVAGWRRPGSARPPQWFTEGLAVFASNGGGAEGMTDDEAALAIRDGVAVILDARPWHDFAALGFSREPSTPQGWDMLAYRQRLAYRQAGMFVAWLRARDETRFALLLRALEDGETFANAFGAAFRQSPDAAWTKFAAGLQASR